MTEQTLLSVHPRYLISRIADSATVLNDIQDTTAGDSFSISTGYPEAYARPFSKGGKPLNRSELNNVFNLLSQLHFYWQMGGVPVWDNRIATGEGSYETIGGYPRNARVFKMIGNTMEEFLSLEDNNHFEPTLTSTEHWKKVTMGGDAVTKDYVDNAIQTLSGSAQSADGTLQGLIDAQRESLMVTITTLSGSASSTDAAISVSIGTVSSNLSALSSVVSGMSTSGSISGLSANAKLRDDSLASSISSLSSNTSTAITTLSQSISALSGNASATDSSISLSLGTVSSNLVELSGVVSSLATSGAIGTLSANAESRDNSLASSIGTLSSRTSGIDSSVSELSGMVGTISGHAQTTDERIATLADRKIEQSAIVTEITESSLDTTVPGTHSVYAFVNSSIVNLAAYYLTKNAAGDAFTTKAELNAAISSNSFYNGGEKREPQKNDYCIVQEDEDHVSQHGGGLTTRYIYDGGQWVFQYSLNNSSFSTAQLASINSKMTEAIHRTITSNIQTLSGYTQSLSAYSLTSHSHSIYATTSTVSSLRNTVNRNTDSISSLNTTITALGTSLSSVSASLGSVSSTVNSVTGSIGSLSAEISSINTTLSNFGSAISAISSSLGTLSGTVDGLSAVYMKIMNMQSFDQWT